MRQKPTEYLRGTKDWSPSSSERRPFESIRPTQAPASRKTTTWKTVAAIAIVGVVALAVLQETGVIKLFSWK